jgi:hypothetical protein
MAQGPIRIAANPTSSQSANFAALTAGTQIKTGPGVLVSINTNTAGTGAASITLFDGISAAGKKLGTFSTLAQGQALVNFAFTIGLFAVVTGTTSGDITVGFR